MQQDHDLQQIFPEMKPLKDTPTLSYFGGFGFAMYGERDEHRDTKTYVKTHFLCLFFIPIFALGAYRVLQTGYEMWRVVGRVPLSSTAKKWNIVSLLAILSLSGLGGWKLYTTSPLIIAARDMYKAKTLKQQGRWGNAAKLYTKVASGTTLYESSAREALRKLINDAANAPFSSLPTLFKSTLSFQRRFRDIESTVNLRRIAWTQLKQRGSTYPKHALTLIDVTASLLTPAKERHALRKNLLVIGVKKYPKDVTLASALALIYEKKQMWSACYTLLSPLKAQLGTTEGARILGQWYTKKGDFETAHNLLLPYVEKKLKVLHKAEKAFSDAFVEVRQKTFEALKRGDGPTILRTRAFSRWSKADKRRFVINHINTKLKTSTLISKRREALARASRISPVALSLGIVILQRAKRAPSKALKQKRLKLAERLFLSIQGVAGQSIQYHIALGQVYYWLDKSKKARQTFQRVLTKTKRSPKALYLLAKILRNVGELAWAKKLLVELYKRSPNKKYKISAVNLLVHLGNTTTEERLKWLRKVDPKDASAIRVQLNNVLAEKAMEEGRYTQAVSHLRDVLAFYRTQPKTSVIYNNGAITYLSLFGANGILEHFTKAYQWMQKAQELSTKNDTTTLSNLASIAFNHAVLQRLNKHMDVSLLNGVVQREDFSFLYKDEKSRRAYIDKLASHPDTKRAISLYKKMFILSPKGAHAYFSLAGIYAHLNQHKKFKQLCEKINTSALDLSPYKQKQSTRKESEKRQQNIRYLKDTKRAFNRARKKKATLPSIITGTRYVQLLLRSRNVIHAKHRKRALSLAKRFYTTNPSAATRRAYIKAQLASGLYAVAKHQPALARFLKRARSHISLTQQFAWWTSRNRPQSKNCWHTHTSKLRYNCTFNPSKLFHQRAIPSIGS
ncbi:MAG TPA: hypothetical protein DCE42_05765 [Myxococcales bacterium]|nr:hypothetical protein [Myxococcales bacterium]